MNIVKQLTKVSKLGKTDLREIRKLVDICKKADGFETKFYYNILKDRRIPEFDDYFYYLNGNLVGYLAIFCFKENEAEVSACVHPKNRHQGIFKRLFAEASDELRRRGIQDALLLVQHATQPAETICEHYNATFSHAEHEMTAKRFVDIPDLPEIILRDVTKDDAMELARIDAAGFDTDFNKMVYRFLNGMNDKDRTVWMATHNGENIGKVHVRFDEDGKGYIHDLCVPHEHRRKRYAMSMVQETLIKLKKMGFKVVYLDVEATNPNAIELYAKCGFETTAIHDFWRYPIAPK
jgi:ribosomal protein S18 acetylase RimI-like enzyme